MSREIRAERESPVERSGSPIRAQANLIALVAGLVVLTATTALALTLAGAAFDGADRSVEDRQIATALSERLVAQESPLTDRANVLDRTVVEQLDAPTLDSTFPVAQDRAVRIRLDEHTILERGNPTGGATIRRIVLVSDPDPATIEPRLTDANGYETTIPRRTTQLALTIDPPDGTTVSAVRANDRVVLLNESGLDGTFAIEVSRFETITLSFEVDGALDRGDVTFTYYPAETTKGLLEVTVGEKQ